MKAWEEDQVEPAFDEESTNVALECYYRPPLYLELATCSFPSFNCKSYTMSSERFNPSLIWEQEPPQRIPGSANTFDYTNVMLHSLSKDFMRMIQQFKGIEPLPHTGPLSSVYRPPWSVQDDQLNQDPSRPSNSNEYFAHSVNHHYHPPHARPLSAYMDQSHYPSVSENLSRIPDRPMSLMAEDSTSGSPSKLPTQPDRFPSSSYFHPQDSLVSSSSSNPAQRHYEDVPMEADEDKSPTPTPGDYEHMDQTMDMS
ncbi:hypothetical protein M231_03828 [Tremella mesenterica]|uniref:Uncharacterized protein n=1 Tax=Tremella mesenterica TaxID=5217 RepID=A0A4Q1BM41_TREME|nr:hypothetical protein M231_03828 [Tremella mesenterica]